jgi:alpha-tubulin suppressor-like RCC1 family protein
MGVLSLGGSAQQIAAGMHHACAILDTGDVRCWGSNWTSQLGYPGIDVVGDDEAPADMPTVSLGGTVEQLALGSNHSCALLEGGSVRCWGQNGMGQLGISGYDVVGDDEDPADAPVLQLGGPAQQVVAGNEFSCALMEDGTVRCWGRDDLEQLGGADPVVLPTQAVQIAAGEAHVCAVLETGDLLCWGDNSEGQLGNGSFDLACP